MAAMFNAIAATYDQINRYSSFGLDGYWRNRLIRRLKTTDAQHVLDVACGTGVLSWAIVRKLHLKVTGLDLSTYMLAEAKKKAMCRNIASQYPAPVFIEGCAEKLPFPDHTFDAVTIAFGVRNFAHRPAAFNEAWRVLRPDGTLLILEFSTPKNPIWSALFRLYFRHILPLWGAAVAGNKKAYHYLPHSVDLFPPYEAICQELSKAGFSRVQVDTYTGGVAVLYEGKRI